MANAIFPCPFCGRRMGVNRDLLGRHVRCPHCKQVIQAPAVEGGTAAPGSAKETPKPPPPVESPRAPEPVTHENRDTPTFAKHSRESTDSILGEEEESEDEVFASRSQAPKLPPDLSAFMPRLAGGGQVPLVVAKAGSDATDLVDPAKAAGSPAPQMPAAWGPQSPQGPMGPSATAVEPFDPNTLKKPGAVDVTNLQSHLPRPQFQAPPADAKGTSAPMWPAALNFKPVAEPPPAPKPAPPPPPVNPWAAYDLTTTQAPSLPEPPAGVPPLMPPSQGGFVPNFLEMSPPTVVPPPPPPAPPPVQPAPIPYQQSAPTATFAPMEPAPAPVAPPMPAPAPAAAPQSGIMREEAIQPTLVRAAPSARDRGAERGGGSGIAMLLLAFYGLAATAAAVYGFLFYKPAQHLKTDVDFSTIPDVIGQYPPADRKKVGNLRVPLDGPLPENLKVKLGETIQVGQLEVTPLGVEEKKPVLRQRLKDREDFGPPRPGSNPGLVLRLKLKNTSSDLVFHPTDPVFTRFYDPSKKEPQPGTGVVVGGRSFWGGAFQWPYTDSKPDNPVAEEVFEGQEQDSKPLEPGEERETVIIAPRNDPQLMKLIKTPGIGTVLWRVQLRRGMETIDGKDVSMTAIIGVKFEPKEIQTKG